MAQPAYYAKVFRHALYPRLEMTSTSFAVQAAPGTRLVVNTPDNEATRTAMERIIADPDQHRFPAGPLTRRARAIFLRSRNGEPKAAQTSTSRSRLTVSHQFLRSPGEPLSVDLHWIIPQAQVVT